MVSKFFKLLGGLTMGFVIVALPFALLFDSIGRILFSPDEIVRLVESNSLNMEIMAGVAERSVNGVSTETMTTPLDRFAMMAFRNFTHEDWVNFFEVIVPSEVISQTLREMFNGIFVWLDSDAEYPSFQISLGSWKSVMETNSTLAVDMVLAKMPDCTAEDLTIFTAGAIISEENFPLCNPPEPMYSRLRDIMRISAPARFATLPDGIDISQDMFENLQGLAQLKSRIVWARSMMFYSWFWVTLVYMIGVPLGARTLKGLFQWSGWPLVLVGGGTLAGAAALVFGQDMVIGIMLNSIKFIGVIRVVADRLMRASISQVAQPLLLEGGVLVALGVGGIIGAVIVEKYLNKRTGSQIDETAVDEAG